MKRTVARRLAGLTAGVKVRVEKGGAGQSVGPADSNSMLEAIVSTMDRLGEAVNKIGDEAALHHAILMAGDGGRKGLSAFVRTRVPGDNATASQREEYRLRRFFR